MYTVHATLALDKITLALDKITLALDKNRWYVR